VLEDETAHTGWQETILPAALGISVIHKPADDKRNKQHGRPHWTFLLLLQVCSHGSSLVSFYVELNLLSNALCVTSHF
jgi:hypothetical protein